MIFSYPGSYWQLWKQGVNALLVLYLVLIIVAVPYALIRYFVNLNGTTLVIEIAFGLVLLVVLFVALPLVTSGMKTDPGKVRELCAAHLEPLIDQCAARAGLSWKDHFLGEVNNMLQTGQLNDARMLYQAKTGVSTQQAEHEIIHWPLALLARKLIILDEHLGNVANAMVVD